ncbi:hypothetical protein F5Y17DRAFT_99431 [Xylariaceae sp. FL0594]|nr:hypothetical protein F5Y17DRAFT_99431 [Xylariaceae sp. FL0594]
MPPQLLPASAAAFAPRASSVNVVLGSKVEPWLTATLKRINRVKRPLNSVPQHQRCLTETLSSPNAIWTLASLMLPKHPESEVQSDPDSSTPSYSLIHIEAYIVHVDMVLRHEVAYKLTPDTIEALVEHHKDVFTVDAKAGQYDWPDKEKHAKKLHEDFVQAINKYVYRTKVNALEGLEEEGAGELLEGRSEDVKNSILALLRKPLLPPPPKMVDIVRQPPLLPSSPAGAAFWTPTTHSSGIPAPVDSWQVLPSSPAVTSSSTESTTPLWTNMALHELQLPSPTPSFSQPFSSAGMFYSSPMVAAPIPALPLPSMLASHCGVNMGYGGFGGFGWDRYQEYATTM